MTSHAYLRAKRAIDVGVVLLAAPVVVPVALLLVAAVRVDSPGSAVFTQKRTGRHGHRFEMYKFRTMVSNAEELKAQLAPLNELPWPDFKITNDPRITRVGKFLRQTSLDELPQLYNVLRGDMSLVGPRPTSFSANTYNLWHTARLEVRPGLTGLWQVSSRHSSTFDERLRQDVHYMRTMSLRGDLRILLMTFGSVFHRSGA
jgi:lipopolysaccharide/colanic/teichoic acid biosynthesis glycosyltransferase